MELIFKIESFEVFKKVSEELLTSLHKPEQGLLADVENDVISNGKEDLRRLIFTYNFDLHKVQEFISLSCWDKDKVQWFNAELDRLKHFIFHSILLYHNSNYGDALSDYNWSLKLVFGTSESKSLKYSLCQLVLSVLNTNSIPKQILFDFNKESLAKLIYALENDCDLN